MDGGLANSRPAKAPEDEDLSGACWHSKTCARHYGLKVVAAGHTAPTRGCRCERLAKAGPDQPASRHAAPNGSSYTLHPD